ncbi:MAG: PLP-dependent aminotransferase family protein [Pseudomonadota bacterium]
MPKFKGEGAFLPFLELDRTASEPLARQLDRHLRAAILTGRLAVGQRLPATRALSKELGVSRSTVVTAFAQLAEEGYLESRVGSGSYVALARALSVNEPHRAEPSNSAPQLSRRGQTAVAGYPLGGIDASPNRPFTPNIPDFDLFPQRTWNRLTNRVQRSLTQQLMNYGDAAGFRPLRRAAARYLSDSRGVACEAEQVIVTSGTQRAFNLVPMLLLEAGDRVIVEDPGGQTAHQALRAQGCRLVPVPVDRSGLQVRRAVAAAPDARLAYVTPSCQYPLGVTLSVSRRLELLDWATERNAWILEDDEDSEFRFIGRPVPAMQGLDRAGRVVYAWSFSEVLFPALRLGLLVLPPGLVEPFAFANGVLDRGPPTLPQAVLCEFINDGYLASHVRRMRAIYAARRHALVAALEAELGGLVQVDPVASGLRVILRLPPGCDDRAAVRAAAAQGITCFALSPYGQAPDQAPGLLLGFAGTPESQMAAGVRQLAAALVPLIGKKRDAPCAAGV